MHIHTQNNVQFLPRTVMFDFYPGLPHTLYVGVLGRSRTLLCCVFRPLYCVRTPKCCTTELLLRAELICTTLTYQVFIHLCCYMSPALNGRVLHYSALNTIMVFMGMTSLMEGKSPGLCLVQLCTKYRLVSTTAAIYIYNV